MKKYAFFALFAILAVAAIAADLVEVPFGASALRKGRARKLAYASVASSDADNVISISTIDTFATYTNGYEILTRTDVSYTRTPTTNEWIFAGMTNKVVSFEITGTNYNTVVLGTNIVRCTESVIAKTNEILSVTCSGGFGSAAPESTVWLFPEQDIYVTGTTTNASAIRLIME